MCLGDVQRDSVGGGLCQLRKGQLKTLGGRGVNLDSFRIFFSVHSLLDKGGLVGLVVLSFKPQKTAAKWRKLTGMHRFELCYNSVLRVPG